MAGDTGNQENTPLSKKELRKQKQLTREQESIRQKNQEGRRNILKAIVGVGVTAATGGIGWNIFNQPKSEKPSQSTRIDRSIEPLTEPLSQEALIIQSKLIAFDREILNNPEAISEIAPRVSQLAIDFLSKELGYDPKRYDGKIFYLLNEDYNKVFYEKANCIQTNSSQEDGAGFTTYQNNEIYLNLNAALYENPRSRTVRVTKPAALIFYTTTHELLHASAPSKNLENRDLEIKQRGLGILIPRLDQSTETGLCYVNSRRFMEESLVEDATMRLMAKIGEPTAYSPDYLSIVEKYRDGIINRFFNGDHMPLLRLHQQTKQEEFFILIGEKLGHTAPEKAGQEGERYMLSLMNQGTSR